MFPVSVQTPASILLKVLKFDILHADQTGVEGRTASRAPELESCSRSTIGSAADAGAVLQCQDVAGASEVNCGAARTGDNAGIDEVRAGRASDDAGDAVIDPVLVPAKFPPTLTAVALAEAIEPAFASRRLVVAPVRRMLSWVLVRLLPVPVMTDTACGPAPPSTANPTPPLIDTPFAIVKPALPYWPRW